MLKPPKEKHTEESNEDMGFSLFYQITFNDLQHHANRQAPQALNQNKLKKPTKKKGKNNQTQIDDRSTRNTNRPNKQTNKEKSKICLIPAMVADFPFFVQSLLPILFLLSTFTTKFSTNAQPPL